MNSILEYQTIEALVNAHDSAADAIKAGISLLCEAEAVCSQALGSHGHNFLPDDCRLYLGNAKRLKKEALEKLKENYWRYVFKQMGIRELMTPKKRAEFDKMFSEHKTPDFTLENVNATHEENIKNCVAIYEEAIQDCFQRIIPANADRKHKTNSIGKIGKKIILKYGVRFDRGFFWGLRESAREIITELDKAFHVLDGKGFPKYPNCASSNLNSAANVTDKRSEYETPYFRFKWHKTGTLHIEFLRLDLLARFNQIGAGQSNVLQSAA